MGEYTVKGSVPFPIYFFEQDEPISFEGKPYTRIPIPVEDFPIPVADAVSIWEGGGGYLKTYGVAGSQSQTWNVTRKTLTGSNHSYQDTIVSSYNLEPGGAVFVWAFVLSDGTFRIQAFPQRTDDYEHALYQVNGSYGYWGNELFDGTWDEDSPLVEYVEDWDESPSADENDPDRTGPQGGEFADTNPLGFGNDDIDIGDTVQELSYSGFITAYQLDAGEVIAIGEAIFTTATWTNLWNKFNGVGDPINYIISAIEIPYNARSETSKNFNLGGVSVDGPNGPVALHVMNKRYHVLDFGSLTLKETWGTEKDYSTTDVAIYLPYVGVKDLDTSIIMNSSIQVKCILDSWNGELLYVVVVNNKAAAYKYLGSKGIVYRFYGNCGTVVPIGKVDYSSQILALAGSFAAMGVGLATGMPTGALSYTVGNEFGATGDISNGANPKMVGGGLAGMMGALTMGPKVSMAGGSGGAVARGDYQKPYLIIKQSVPVYPKGWRAHFGAPRYQTLKLGDLTGYVKCADVHAENIEGANDAERAAIEQALKAGVFVN